MTEREKEVIATKRDIKILYYKINLKITQLESKTSERISYKIRKTNIHTLN
jgi:predicted transcriptional regulator